MKESLLLLALGYRQYLNFEINQVNRYFSYELLEGTCEEETSKVENVNNILLSGRCET